MGHVSRLRLSPFPPRLAPSRRAERSRLLSTFLWLSFTKAPNVSCVGFVPVFGALPSVPSPAGHGRLGYQASFPSTGRTSRAPSPVPGGCLSPSPRYSQAGREFHRSGQGPTRKGFLAVDGRLVLPLPAPAFPRRRGVVSTRRPRCARSRPPGGGGCDGAWGGAGGSGGTCC